MIIRLFTTIKNNWKKSAVAAGILFYGANSAQEHIKISNCMKSFCQEAAYYGDITVQRESPKRILVLLNPAANKKKAEKTFKKYCEPILHLAGFMVDIVRTESQGQAKTYIESLENMPDAIVIAGGDGTISESITGLMRRNSNCPVGFLPIGSNNNIAAKYFDTNPQNQVEQVQLLGRAALAVVRGNLQERDVIKFQPISNEDDSFPNQKAIYALGSFQWGPLRDTQSIKEKYWYYGSLKKYASIVLNAFNNDLSWTCKANVVYTPPCAGCQNCVSNERGYVYPQRWWSRFVPKFKLGSTTDSKVDYSKIINKNCNQEIPIDILSSDIFISTQKDNEGLSKLLLCSNEVVRPGWDFITKSFKNINEHHETKQSVESRTISIIPDDKCLGDNKFYSIDGEDYDVRPLKICLIPKALKVYTYV